jgi:hypothetical protein
VRLSQTLSDIGTVIDQQDQQYFTSPGVTHQPEDVIVEDSNQSILDSLQTTRSQSSDSALAVSRSVPRTVNTAMAGLSTTTTGRKSEFDISSVAAPVLPEMA